MTTIEVDAPEFLADLLQDVLGERLTTFRAAQHDCPIRVGFGEPPKEPFVGLFIDERRAYGVHHHGMTWEVYSGGRPRFGHAWDDNDEDVFGEPIVFEDWVRGEVTSLVDARAHREVRELWEALDGEGASARVDAVLELASRFHRDESYWHAAARALRALLDIESLGSDAPTAFEDLGRVIPHLHGRFDEARSDWGLFLRHGAACLRGRWRRELPDVMRSRIGAEVERILGALGEGLPAHRFLGYCREVASCPPAVRGAFAAAFREQATRPEHLHMVAAEFRARPLEVVPLLEAALELAEDDRTIASALQGAYLQAGEAESAAEMGRRLRAQVDEEAGLEELGDDVQAWIDNYNLLANEFSASSPRTSGDPDERGRRLIALQDKLNQHWLDLGPAHHDRAVEQGRFLSSGGVGYVGWLRNQERYQEAVDYVMDQLADDQLSTLRHRAHAWAFENFLNNGFGSFLDSGEPQHLSFALERLTHLESFLELGATGDLLYQGACILARAGETRRALNYVQRAIAKGESIRVMWGDSDLESLRGEPLFQRLREQA
jgi:hypothetical protein